MLSFYYYDMDLLLFYGFEDLILSFNSNMRGLRLNDNAFKNKGCKQNMQ